MDSSVQKEFLDNAAYRMDESLRMIKICLDKLSDNMVWKKPNASSNSIGNLVLHLCGNITQYGITSLQGLKDMRDRDSEFSGTPDLSRNELFKKLKLTIEEAKTTFFDATSSDLVKKRKVQGFEFSGVGNILHVVEHLSYHTGQIAILTKIFNDEELGFYDGIDLNAKNGG